MVDVDSSIIDRLKALKAKSGMTALQIAEKSKLPASTVTRILSGKTTNPTVTTVVAIYKAMGGTAADVFGEDVRVDVVSEVSPTSKESAQLIELYKEIIKTKDRYIRTLVIALVLIVAFVLIVLLIDVLNGRLDFARYMHSLGLFSWLC